MRKLVNILFVCENIIVFHFLCQRTDHLPKSVSLNIKYANKITMKSKFKMNIWLDKVNSMIFLMNKNLPVTNFTAWLHITRILWGPSSIHNCHSKLGSGQTRAQETADKPRNTELRLHAFSGFFPYLVPTVTMRKKNHQQAHNSHSIFHQNCCIIIIASL